MTYSIDFRKKVLSIKEKEGLSFEKTSKRFGVSKRAVFNWSKSLYPKVNKNRPCLKIDMEKFKQDLDYNPDSYQYERAERFGVSKSAIWYALKRTQVTYKKRP